MKVVSMESEWDAVEFVNRSGSNGGVRKNEVWFLKTSGGSLPCMMKLARNLTDELCWSAGDRLTLYRSKGGNMFMLKPSSVGLITLKADTKRPDVSPLFYTSTDMALNFRWDKWDTVFDAWVDGDALVFKPRIKSE